MIRCGNRSVHSGGYGEISRFALTDDEVCFRDAENEAGGARAARQCGGFTFVENAYRVSCFIERLDALLAESFDGIGRCDGDICCILGASRAVSSPQTSVFGSGRAGLVTRSKNASSRSSTPTPSVRQCAVWPRVSPDLGRYVRVA